MEIKGTSVFEVIMKKGNLKKTLLVVFLSLACAFAVAGATFAIYTYVSDRNSSSDYDDSEWTKNY